MLFFGAIAAVHLGAFSVGAMLDRRVGIICFFALLIYGVWAARRSCSPMLLTQVYLVVYALPFIAILPYVVDRNYLFWKTPLAQSYLRDPTIPELMIAVGTTGILGLIIGTGLGGRRPPTDVARVAGSPARRLPLPPFVLFAIGAVGLSWLAAPSRTILTAAYASSEAASAAESFNVSGAAMASYILLIYLWVDSERDERRAKRKTKQRIVLASTLLIVLALQLPRGDRESSGLILALVLLHLSRPGTTGSYRRRLQRSARRLALPIVVTILAFIAVGSLRSQLSTSERRPVSIVSDIAKGFEQGTWTGVLLTNLSTTASAKYEEETFFLSGQTYLDYVKSLPPSPIASAIDLDRPIDVDRGPGWWTQDISSGGVHAVIVPYRNFGALGVFAVLLLYGYLIARVDSAANFGRRRARMLYGTMAASPFLWFWYGDMGFIRALTILAIVMVVDAVVSRPKPTPSTRPKRPAATP